MSYAERAHYSYYIVAQAWVRMLSPGPSILDIGARDAPTASWGSYTRRYAIDKEVAPLQEVAGVPIAATHGDYLDWVYPEPMHVTTCLQVIEHLTDDELRPFVDRLFARTRHLIVSVPFEWAKGEEPGHHQDPISLEKFVDHIMRRPPLEHIISLGGRHHRIIARWEL